MESQYDLPYPLLAGSNASGDDAYDQPVRFGIFGEFSDVFGQMPAVVIIDRGGTHPEIASTYRGRSTFDRPKIDEFRGT